MGEKWLWFFFFAMCFLLWFGYFTDIAKNGYRIDIPTFLQRILFLKEDNQKKLLAVVIYQAYIEVITILTIISFFNNYEFKFNEVCKVFLKQGGIALVVLIVWMRIVERNILEIKKYWEK